MILGVALALCAPIEAVAGMPAEFWFVAQEAVRRPVVDIQRMQDYATGTEGLRSDRRRTIEPEAVRLAGDRGAGSQRGSPRRGSDTRLRPSSVSDDHPDAGRSILWGASDTVASRRIPPNELERERGSVGRDDRRHPLNSTRTRRFQARQSSHRKLVALCPCHRDDLSMTPSPIRTRAMSTLSLVAVIDIRHCGLRRVRSRARTLCYWRHRSPITAARSLA